MARQKCVGLNNDGFHCRICRGNMLVVEARFAYTVEAEWTEDERAVLYMTAESAML